MSTSSTAGHLYTVMRHWPDLRQALGAKSAPSWPPAGRMSEFTRDVEQRDADQLAVEQRDAAALRLLERDPSQIGERPIPIRPAVYETMRAVRQDLLDVADHIAAAVQRSPVKPPAPWRSGYARTRAERVAWEDHARRVEAAQQDAADPRRWSWSGVRPDAPVAALWLLDRVLGRPGPFRPLHVVDTDLIAGAAGRAARQVEAALDVGAGRAYLTRPCPRCAGRLTVYGGAGALPVARCRGCGQVWGGSKLTA